MMELYNERKRFIMATQHAKTRKPMTSASKGTICLVVLLALVVFVSVLGLTGMNLDAEGISVLLPWVPVSSASWPESLPLDRSLGGGNYVEYAYTLPENASETALQDSANTIRNRLAQLGEADAEVSVKDDALRIDLRNVSESRLYSLRTMSTYPGHFVFADTEGNEVLTEKDIKNAEVSVKYNANGTSYTIKLIFNATKEGAQKLADSGLYYVTVTCDDSTLSSYALVSDGKVEASMGTTNSAYNSAYNYAFLLNNGAVEVDLSQRDDGTTSASMGIVVTVVVILLAVLLVGALAYLIATGKLTGVSAFLSVWCAVVLALFLVATVVVPTVTALSVACLIAILLGIVIAMYTAVTRTDAISKQIGEGATPKAATKLGFKMTAKSVWLIHGAVMALALILMIFAFSRPVGYTLAMGVFASAVATLVMRALQLCCTAITNQASLFGKVK